MKYIYKSSYLFIIITLYCLLSIRAIADPNPSWGPVRNGLRIGLDVKKQVGWRTNHVADIICIIYIQNLNSNRVWAKLAPMEERVRALISSNGSPIHMRSEFQIQKDESGQKRSSALKLLVPNVLNQCDSFYLTDQFAVKTNGLYALIASERIAISTNYTPANRVNGGFFRLPAVTNRFLVDLFSE